MLRRPDVGRIEAAEFLYRGIDQLLGGVGPSLVVRTVLFNAGDDDDLRAVALAFLDETFGRLRDDEVVALLREITRKGGADLKQCVVDDDDALAALGGVGLKDFTRYDGLCRSRVYTQAGGGNAGRTCWTYSCK